MQYLDLGGSWQMKCVSDPDTNPWGTAWTPATVPGSVICDLINAGRMYEPFYRDNEYSARRLMEFDYEYKRNFSVDAALLASDKVILCCEGLDTLATVFLNGRIVAHTDDMHRTYEFDLRNRLLEGENEIRIIFASALKFITENQARHKLFSPNHSIQGHPHLRKSQSMFGWDSDPRIPDAGIWKPIGIKAYNTARFEDIYITQEHEPGGGRVTLGINVRTEKLGAGPAVLEAAVYSPEGGELFRQKLGCTGGDRLTAVIDNPRLWWPNGLGEHPLYKVSITLTSDKTGTELERRDMNIGLRTIKVRREKDEYGECFEFVVNGQNIFAMGANYIPEDKFMGRCSPERTHRLIKDCADANFNMIRVWGGGIFPLDCFFDYCDQYGIIVWQDLMFACATYEMTDKFLENVKAETRDNVKRIRHHASLGLWCGNNEIVVGMQSWFSGIQEHNIADYKMLFEDIFPRLMAELDPATFYWPSSPYKGSFDISAREESVGDEHYWKVWHGGLPYTAYGDRYFRFCSEFGIQSFPTLKTVKAYTLPKDRQSVFSPIMKAHQRNGNGKGNEQIMRFISEDLNCPERFEDVLYASHVVHAAAMKFGVDHWRRNRGRCMGALYWQLNDCWPAPTWAGIDYYGRWKALHYVIARSFAPVTVSAALSEEGIADIFVLNETLSEVSGALEWRILESTGKVVESGAIAVTVPAMSAASSAKLSTGCKDRGDVYLEYTFKRDGGKSVTGTSLFVKPKDFKFIDPAISVQVDEQADNFVITLECAAYAGYVELDFAKLDCRFSDNYFDMSPGAAKTVEVPKSSMSRAVPLDKFKAKMKIRSLYDIR